MTRSRRNAFLALAALAVLLAAAAYPAYLFVRQAPVVRYQPVCVHYGGGAPRYYNEHLKTVDGEPSDEFWEVLRDYYRLDDPNRDYGVIRTVGGEVYITISMHLNLFLDLGKGNEWLRNRAIDMKSVPYVILQRRIAEGRFGPDVQRRYMIRDRDADGGRRLMKSYECPLAEALMIEGGALAGPPRGASG
jgi:hypothetical protein